MRWERLFDDLEGQLAAAEAVELAAEVADRSRREAARLRLVDRLRPGEGGVLSLRLPAVGVVRGRLTGLGPDWLLLAETAGREALVPRGAVLAVGGLTARASEPGSEGVVAGRVDLRLALRAVARDRSGVAVTLRDGTVLTGTLDRVGADHVDLAEHPPGEPRRPRDVRTVLAVPTDALVVVRSS